MLYMFVFALIQKTLNHLINHIGESEQRLNKMKGANGTTLFFACAPNDGAIEREGRGKAGGHGREL